MSRKSSDRMSRKLNRCIYTEDVDEEENVFYTTECGGIVECGYQQTIDCSHCPNCGKKIVKAYA